MPDGDQFDLIVIGGGPGGYVAAIRAAQLGKSVACIEQRQTLGGTCLNVGCIPSKALLESSEHFVVASHDLAAHGVKTGKVALDLKTMQARKEKIVGELTAGIAGLFKKNKITHFNGRGHIVSPTAVEIYVDGTRKRTVEAGTILIATGSEPIPMPGVDFDGKTIISSTEALELSSVPKHLIIIGGGVIGLELGSVWKRLGAEVTVIEMLPALLGGVDDQIARAPQRALAKQGLVFHLDTRVTKIEKGAKGVTVTAQPAQGEALSFEGDHVLVGIGRRPHTADLGAEEVGVEFTESRRIKVNAKYQTAVGSIYAIGDVIDGPMLAHKASEEGIAVAEHLAGKPSHVNYEAIPWIIYTSPEVAWVGRGENQLKQAGVAYRTGSYPFQANPRAKTMGTTEGLVKVIADAKTDRLLGVFVVGPRASDVIAEVALAFEFGACAEDLARAVHAHPTLSEALKEAALGVDKRAIHI